MIKVYGVPTCDKIKKTYQLLEANNIDFEFINVRKKPLLEKTLKQVVDQLGMESVVNKRGMLYRKLGLKDKNLSDQQLFDALLNEQGMIKRPLIEKKGTYISGYDENKILNFLK